jgi:hypothetical protein
MSDNCSQNIDPLKLLREGTSQDARASDALNPGYAPVSARSVPHGIVFAQRYAELLKYFDVNNTTIGNWTAFFGGDMSVPLAVATIEDVEAYKANTQSWFAYLNNLENVASTASLRDRFGYLYAAIGTLAQALDAFKQSLPTEIALKGTLQNLIKTQLAPSLKRLIAYYKAGDALGLINAVAPSPAVQILRRPVIPFATVLGEELSGDWSEGAAWNAYLGSIAADASVYGPSASVFVQINHCSTHNLFRSVFDQFLKVFARLVGDAKQALDDTLTNSDRHEPHYALYLAFLQLLEHVRAAGNTLTQRHLDFYYREILGFRERTSEPGHVHLLVALGRQAASREFKPGELFKAGKDAQGKDAFFANRSDFVANQARVAALQTFYRHGDEKVGTSTMHQGRLFASPVANSDDGLGAPLTSPDQSWHPFYNKVYIDGALTQIRMPEADIGFAVASHYLLMAEGTRRIYLEIEVSGYTGAVTGVEFRDDVRCFLTTEKGWLEKQATLFAPTTAQTFRLELEVGGADAPIVPYSAAVHGYTFQTDLPLLLIKLKQDNARSYAYSKLQDISVAGITLKVCVDNLRTLAVSNDFGPLDTSKPFQPFGPSPVKDSSLIVGSKEIFQKTLLRAWLNLVWPVAPSVYKGGTLPNVSFEFLSAGQWSSTTIPPVSVGSSLLTLDRDLEKPVLDEPDFSANEPYGTQSRQGFVRLRLAGNFGQDAHQTDLLKYLRKDSETDPGKPPVGPTASALSMGYSAGSKLVLNSALPDVYENRPGKFFHLMPFGTAEQHPYLIAGAAVFIFPRFEFVRDNTTLSSEAEFYIGIAGLAPPQNLSLLFQVADGTANPLTEKPKPHIDWSYLCNNRWIAFDNTSVRDGTDELLNSGIATFAMPRETTNGNTLLQTGLFWIRAAVHEKSDAVCRLQLVAAQATEAVFADKGNSPDFSAVPMPPETISKLDRPDPAVKSISQPFPSFGGRGAERLQAFYTRVSERLRHKDRAIDLWDYEHLILEAFPQVYKVKCLNHTCYEPSESGAGIYRELAPGHVTVVAIPRLQAQQRRNPLKPYTSLGTLRDIEAFLKRRAGCFARLHVRNPQFEEVRVSFTLRLHDGFDESYYKLQLKQAITRFLSPWAFSGSGAPSFGGKIYKSVLIDFVEDQPYVDYVTDFQVFQDIAGVAGTVDLDEVVGSRAVSILVSAPASKHEISIIKPAADAELAEACACDA